MVPEGEVNMENLKPCPFGCKIKVLNMGVITTAPNFFKEYYIRCKCGASGPVCPTEQAAKDAWNRRNK